MTSSADYSSLSYPVSSSDMEKEVARNVAQIRERIAVAAQRAGKTPEDILLVGVTKTVSRETVVAGIKAGLTIFGENYIQEARTKIPLVAEDAPEAEWHFIGHLQSNKARYCPELFSVVESVDSFSLAKELARAASKHGKTAQRVLIEVNLDGNPDRAGVSPDQTLEICEAVAQIPGILLEGLMGMAPYDPDPEAARPYFCRLRSLWEQLPEENRHTLSMGMSGDFETAIEEGSTLLRIGTALFGRRSAAVR